MKEILFGTLFAILIAVVASKGTIIDSVLHSLVEFIGILAAGILISIFIVGTIKTL